MSLAVINLYNDSTFSEAYSKGDFSNPIWKYPPWNFDVKLGQTREKKLWLRNEGPTMVGTIEGKGVFKVTPFDTDGEGHENLIKLAFTEAGLSLAIAGASLNLPDLSSNNSLTFWVKATIEADFTPKDIKSIVLRFEGISIPEVV